MNKSVIYSLSLILLSFLLGTGCSKSDDQREFENRALTMPGGITETNPNGEPTSNTDPDDWQIAPMYQGLITLNSESASLPHPNPVNYNEDITIQIHFRVDEPVDAIEIFKFRSPSDSYIRLRRLSQGDFSSFVANITIEGKSIAESPSESDLTTYRLLIYDGNQNMISYGDVRVQ